MNSSIKIFLTLLLVSLFYSCTERVEIKTRTGESKLAIFGYITNENTQHYIKITRSDTYFSTDAPQGISNATVTIDDGDTVFILTESPETPGLYQTEEMRGEEGKTYTLNISLDFDNDGVEEQYRATTSMPYATRIDSVVLAPSVSFIPQLLLYGLIPNNQRNELALYVTKNKSAETIFDYFMIISDLYFEGYEIDGYELPFVVEDGIAEGDTILFRVSSFSGDFADFISQARSEASGRNPIFSGPPADVKSNVEALDDENTVGIVGAFGVFSLDEKSTISERNFLLPR